ncbi:MAG TPA: hypothetical protein VFN51_00170 [Candidatus Saccharimonadales bacterium]|nr:hypothetical protein [Candidatus Saccharimonadales bacterium]
MSSPANPRKWPLANTISFLFLVAIGIYFFLLYKNALIFGGQRDGRQFTVSLVIGVPIVLMWSIAFMSALRMKTYAVAIRGTQDGYGMNRIADSLLLITLYVILLTSSRYVVGLYKDSAKLGTMVSVENYLPLFTILTSSLLLLSGASYLNKIVPLVIRWRYRLVAILCWLIASALYISRFVRVTGGSSKQGLLPMFVLPQKLLLYTYALPHAIMWGAGLTGCAFIANYSLKVKGSIYRSCLTDLYKGVALVFIGIYISQFFILSNLTINRFSLGLVLVIMLEAVGIIGFYLVYRASGKLDRLEKV